jgi:hypothetical protein
MYFKSGEEAKIKQTGSLTKDLCELCQWFIDHRSATKKSFIF